MSACFCVGGGLTIGGGAWYCECRSFRMYESVHVMYRVDFWGGVWYCEGGQSECGCLC